MNSEGKETMVTVLLVKDYDDAREMMRVLHP